MSSFWIGFLVGFGSLVVLIIIGNVMAVKKGYFSKDKAGESLKEFSDTVKAFKGDKSEKHE